MKKFSADLDYIERIFTSDHRLHNRIMTVLVKHNLYEISKFGSFLGGNPRLWKSNLLSLRGLGKTCTRYLLQCYCRYLAYFIHPNVTIDYYNNLRSKW